MISCVQGSPLPHYTCSHFAPGTSSLSFSECKILLAWTSGPVEIPWAVRRPLGIPLGILILKHFLWDAAQLHHKSQVPKPCLCLPWALHPALATESQRMVCFCSQRDLCCYAHDQWKHPCIMTDKPPKISRALLKQKQSQQTTHFLGCC